MNASHPDPATARYGGRGMAGELVTNEVIRAILAHRSVRAFLPDALAAGTLETLIAAAQSASTSSNLQAWSVVAVQDRERRERLAALSDGRGFIAQSPLFLCWLADLSRLDRVGQTNGRTLDGLDYLEAFMVAVVDAALAAQNAVVAAESLGLGCVYVGALRNDPVAVAAELGLPPNCVAVFGLAVGHPDPAKPTEIKPRLPQAAVLHHERYATAGEAEAVTGYDDTLAEFSRQHGMGSTNWTARVIGRVGTAAALKGRDGMREMLTALGFGLR